ncbi:MAG: Fic family protein [Pseudobdellovibrionaceae bacterium]
MISPKSAFIQKFIPGISLVAVLGTSSAYAEQIQCAQVYVRQSLKEIYKQADFQGRDVLKKYLYSSFKKDIARSAELLYQDSQKNAVIKGVLLTEPKTNYFQNATAQVFQEIFMRVMTLWRKKKNHPLFRGPMATRLFTEAEYMEFSKDNKLKALLEDKETLNWKKTWSWLKSLPSTPSKNILISIHKKVMKDSFFMGFERRRIRVAFVEKIMTEQQALDALEALESKISWTKIDHSKLGGRFREDLDILIDRAQGPLALPAEKILGALESEALRVDPASLRKNKNSLWEVDIYLAKAGDIHKLLDQIIGHFLKSTKDASDLEYIIATTKLELALIGIHPFLDGNGRTIRLFIDWLLYKKGLPVPIHSPAEDFYKPLELQVQERVKGMQSHIEQAH